MAIATNLAWVREYVRLLIREYSLETLEWALTVEG